MLQQSGDSTPARGPQEFEQISMSTAQMMEALTQSFDQMETEATPRQQGNRLRF